MSNVNVKIFKTASFLLNHRAKTPKHIVVWHLGDRFRIGFHPSFYDFKLRAQKVELAMGFSFGLCLFFFCLDINVHSCAARSRSGVKQEGTTVNANFKLVTGKRRPKIKFMANFAFYFVLSCQPLHHAQKLTVGRLKAAKNAAKQTLERLTPHSPWTCLIRPQSAKMEPLSTAHLVMEHSRAVLICPLESMNVWGQTRSRFTLEQRPDVAPYPLRSMTRALTLHAMGVTSQPLGALMHAAWTACSRRLQAASWRMTFATLSLEVEYTNITVR